jgi:ABC-2 type transport system ATP-binding protein
LEKSLTECGLKDVRKRLIRNLSHGFKQRVGIAQALIHDPAVLILDEPTVGLDPAQIKEIRELIKSLRGERTILLSTHILAEVTQICDGVAILNKGKLVTSGTLTELTSSFKEEERALIKLKITGKSISNLIQGLPGVKSVNSSGEGLLVDWHPGQDPRDDIARVIGENKLGLIEIRPQTMNLEDLYLKAISGGVEQ